jgi:anti-sigma regulatory factor (Ser/Thr protein kinase)
MGATFEAYNDQKRLQQILLNFVNNSLKFTKSGGQITIEVSHHLGLLDGKAMDGNPHNLQQPHRYYKISVEDTGVGIPKEVQPKLFTMFGTFDHNKGMNRHGIGLGLTITKKLIEQLGPGQQKIRLESAENRGTRITFLLYQSMLEDELLVQQQESLPQDLVQQVQVQPFAQLREKGNGQTIDLALPPAIMQAMPPALLQTPQRHSRGASVPQKHPPSSQQASESKRSQVCQNLELGWPRAQNPERVSDLQPVSLSAQ